MTGDTTYRYDALGRRISENGNALYYDASGNIIDERNSTSSPAATIQYVYSPVDNSLILRDRALYTGGNIGAIGSGLSERLYAIHDASNSVDTVLGVRAGGGPGVVEERYLYESTGQVIVLDTNGANGLAGSQNSAFNWRILYHGSRDDGTSYYSDFYYLNGTEWNSLTGLPVQEDPTAYLNQKHIYDASVAANARGFTDWVGDHAGTIITFIRIASWANPIVGFTVNYAADVMDRLAPLDGSPGQSLDDALLGGAMDVSGITGIYGYIKGKDIATGSTRGWGSQADRELNGFLGVLQAAPLFGALAKSMVGGMSSGMQGGGMALNNGAAVLTGTWSPGLAGVGATSGLGSLQGLGSIGNTLYSYSSSIFGNSSQANRDLVRSGAVRPTTPYRAGVKAPPQHHVLPQQYREMFWQHGIDIDDFTVEMDEAFHQAIHGGGNWKLAQQVAWQEEWNTRLIADFRVRTQLEGQMLTREEVIDVAEKLMAEKGITGTFVRWRGAK